MKTAEEILAIFREQAILSTEYQRRARKAFGLNSADLRAVGEIAIRLAEVRDECDKLMGIPSKEEGK